ncbi:MAG: SIS domain-containing protein [Pisciglobus halotolerans]|nr:SIS domain-containing protein [Pisciglobus halotolerans]
MEIKNFFNYSQTIFDAVKDQETDTISAAAKMIADSCADGGKLYLFGSGHSHMIAEEAYLRAGGLAFVKAILPPELMLHEMPNKSTYLERLNGYAEILLDLYKVEKKDVLVVISNSGRNNVPVEMCLEAKKRGTTVIALTSLDHSAETTSRHFSGKKIADIADITINNHAPKGDAAYPLSSSIQVGAVSSFTGTIIMQALITQVVANLLELGVDPPVFKSSNLDNADEYNEKLFDTHYGYWK